MFNKPTVTMSQYTHIVMLCTHNLYNVVCHSTLIKTKQRMFIYIHFYIHITHFCIYTVLSRRYTKITRTVALVGAGVRVKGKICCLTYLCTVC